MSSNTLYKQFIIDHYKEPRNWGRLDEYSTHSAVSNRSCGDEMELFLDFTDGLVSEAKYIARGCAISIATMSMLSERLKGKSKEELLRITEEDILSLVGMRNESGRKKCALLSFDALRKALESVE